MAELDDGNLGTKFVKEVSGINQRLGQSKEEFDALGRPGRDNPPCD